MTIECRRTIKAALLVGLLIVLATLVSYPATATDEGTLTITADTTLIKDHHGKIVVGADNVVLDCAGFSVIGSGASGFPSPYGISLSERTGVTVKNCQAMQFFGGFFLEGSSNNTLIGNTARNNTNGFYVFPKFIDPAVLPSSDNVLENNAAIENKVGFRFGATSGNLLRNNVATNNTGGGTFSNPSMGFSFSFDLVGNTLVNNTATGSPYGFHFLAASNNTLIGNRAVNNTRASTNVDQHGNGFFFESMVVPGHGSVPYGDNNVLTGNTAEGNSYIGFTFKGSSNNVLVGNTASDNGGFGIGAGFALDFVGSSANTFLGSSGNTLEGNTVTGNVLGFALRAADNNTFVNNSVKNNLAGFQLTHMSFGDGNPVVWTLIPSTNNTVYRNDIVNNTVQVEELGNPNFRGDNHTVTNAWHRPILQQGNFWSDYNGADDGSGGRVAGDGIGDTLIPHPGPDYDNFPFINEIASTPPPPPPPADTMPPVSSAARSGTTGLAGWFVSPVVVTLSAVDDMSGVANISYQIDSGIFQEYLTPFTLDDGIYTVGYFSMDKAGNVEAVKSFSVEIDTVAPITVVSPIVEPGWYTSPIMVTLTASDATSGVASTVYSIYNGTWEAYTGPFTLRDGVWSVKYYSTDAAGNVEVVNSFDVKIDTITPSPSITSPSEGELFTIGDIEVTWTAVDATSGIDHFEVSLDSGTPVILPATATNYTFTGVADGAHTVVVTVFDAAENSIALGRHFTVDTSVPTEPPAEPPAPSDSGLLLIGISIGVIAAAVAAVLLLTRTRKAKDRGDK